MQYVKIQNVSSEQNLITYGVPQGSTLGPLLFLIYINDLPLVSNQLMFRMFADDTNIFFTHNNPQILQNVVEEELALVYKYCNLNKLTLNLKKTHYVLFKSPKKQANNFKIQLLEQKQHIKYLGVFIDQYLKWDHQIKVVHSKIAKNIGILRILRHYVNIKTLKDIYYSLIYPYLSYGILSWGCTYKTSLEKIRTIQNKCLV